MKPSGPCAAGRPWRWGQRWALSLFKQPDPAYPHGARLRVAALAPAPQPSQLPSHSAALVLKDAFAGSWRLANRSQELVPPDSGTVPAGSAQFALDGVSGTPGTAGRCAWRSTWRAARWPQWSSGLAPRQPWWS